MTRATRDDLIEAGIAFLAAGFGFLAFVLIVG